jgi:probable blue pigment (indigoidine) exporter
MTGRVRTGLMFGALALVWGTQYLVIRSTEADLGAWRSVACRFAVVAALGQLAVGVQGTRAPRGTLGARVAMGVTQALSMGLLYEGTARLPSSVVSVLMSTTPLFVVVIARLWLAERLAVRSVVATLLGMLGVAGLSRAEWGATVPSIGVGLVVAAALASAISKSIGKAIALLPLSILIRDLGCVVALSAGVASLVLEREEPWRVTGAGVAGALYLGVVASTAANLLYFAILRETQVSRLSYLQLVSASVGLVAGVVLGGEQVSMPVLGGAALVLAGAVVHGTSAHGPSVSEQRRPQAVFDRVGADPNTEDRARESGATAER